MLRSVGKIRDGDHVFIIYDPGVEPIHVDLITELSHDDGLVRLSFAATTKDGDGIAKADIVSRLRMSEDVAAQLLRGLRKLMEP